MHEFSPYRVRRDLQLTTPKQVESINGLDSAVGTQSPINHCRIIEIHPPFAVSVRCVLLVMWGAMPAFIVGVCTAETLPRDLQYSMLSHNNFPESGQ